MEVVSMAIVRRDEESEAGFRPDPTGSFIRATVTDTIEMGRYIVYVYNMETKEIKRVRPSRLLDVEEEKQESLRALFGEFIKKHS